MSSDQSYSGVKILLTWLSRALSLAAVVYLVLKFSQSVSEFPSLRFDVTTCAILFANLAAWMANQTIGVYVWQVLLNMGGVSVPFKRCYAIVGRSQIGKYLPGNVFQYVGRVTIGGQQGIPAVTTAATMGIEVVLTLAVTVPIVLIGIWRENYDPANLLPFLSGLRESRLWIVGLVLLGGGVVILVLSASARKWIIDHKAFLKPLPLLRSGLSYALFFVLIGVLLNGIITSLTRTIAPLTWFDASWRFTAAWLIGFIVPGAPGGIGVRELVFVALFGPSLGTSISVGLAVLIRLISTVADALTFGIAILVSRRSGSVS